MRHFTHLSDVGIDGVRDLIERAAAFKRGHPGMPFDKRVLAMLFFNPSLRTRASFEAAMLRGGGHAMVFDVGQGVWPLETEGGTVMDGNRSEHVREAAPVLGRYADALGVRSFAGLVDHDVDHADKLMHAFREWAGVPVVSMESAREHPCQGLADLLTLHEAYGDLRGLPVTLTWTPHIKPLPRAVPNSFLLTAVAMGCEVRLAHPAGFELHQGVLAEARELGEQSGGAFSVTHDQFAALEGSAAVYAKSWGPMGETEVTGFSDWTVTADHLAAAGREAFFMHCLPVRRNLVASDAVLDREPKRFLDQAENRMHGQAAILDWIWNG